MSNPNIRIIGVSGGSGSGKTTFARALAESLPADACALIFQDNYYIDQSARFDVDGGAVNFDHPDSIDFPLLAKHLAELKAGRPVEIPVYDFASHKRLARTISQAPRKLILLDGILIFHSEPVRAVLDELVFFDTPEALRFERRLDRDVKERGRTPEGVHAQFYKQVKPMHDLYVEPTKAFADTIVRDLGDYQWALREYTTKYQKLFE
jgi:uridine kinase